MVSASGRPVARSPWPRGRGRACNWPKTSVKSTLEGGFRRRHAPDVAMAELARRPGDFLLQRRPRTTPAARLPRQHAEDRTEPGAAQDRAGAVPEMSVPCQSDRDGRARFASRSRRDPCARTTVATKPHTIQREIFRRTELQGEWPRAAGPRARSAASRHSRRRTNPARQCRAVRDYDGPINNGERR